MTLIGKAKIDYSPISIILFVSDKFASNNSNIN